MGLLRDLLHFLAGLFVHKPTNLKPSSLSQRHQEFAVLGLGRFGSSVAKTLVERGHTVLAVDRDQDLVQQFADEITQTIRIDTTDEDALRDIDIMSYDTVIIAIGTNFEANIMATVACKTLGVRNVICKAATTKQRDILLKIGADRVVLPEHEGGSRLAQELSTPGMLDQIRLNDTSVVSELRVPRRYIGRPLGELALEEEYGVFVAAVARRDEYVVCPPKAYSLTDEDFLVVIGSEADVIRLIAE